MRRRLSYRQLEIRGMDDLLKDFGQEMLTPDFLPSPKITEPSLLILGGKKHV